MALRRRDWTDLLLQIISFYVIATGAGQLIWNGRALSHIICINVLFIPLIVFLKMTRKMIKSNVSVLLMQFMEIIVYSMCSIGILSFFVSDSFNRNIYVSSAICFAFAVYTTDRKLKKSDIDGEHIPAVIIAVPAVMYIYSSWQGLNSVRIMWLALSVVIFVLFINYHFEDRLCRLLFSDEYDDGFPYRQADLTVSLVKDGICVTTFVILMIILVPLMNVTGNLRTYIRNSNTGIHDTLIEDYEIIDCKGLEIFTNVEKVKLTTYCDTYVSEYGNIKNIKVLTKLTKIKNLEISGVNNSNYDFTKLNNLERLCIKSTKLKKLNLSKNVKLKNLKLAYNPLLKKINLTKNKNLEKINLYGSGVKKITLGKNNKIKNANLNCTFISNYEKCNFNPKTLKTLKICNTQIKKVNLKKYKNLKKLSVTKEVKVIGYKGKKTIYDETL